MAWERGQSPYYSNEKNAQIAKDNAAKDAAVSAAQKADAQNKGLIDSNGNYKTDELDRTFNTSTGKWEAGPNTPTARVGYTNEGGGSSGGSSIPKPGGGLHPAQYYAKVPTTSTPQSPTPPATIPTPTETPTYTPVKQEEYIKKVLSYEEALAMAKSALEPQYVSRYEQSAAQAAQNLGASGLYDSLYPQALMADAKRDIDRDLEAAIQSFALQLKDKSWDEAYALMQSAIGENQFSANFNQGAMLEDRAYNERNLDRMIAQANADREYNLAQQAQDLKVRAQNYYEKQSNWQMGGFDNQYQMQQALAELDNQLQQSNMRLQSELSQQAAAAKSAKSGGSGGGGNVDLGTGDAYQPPANNGYVPVSDMVNQYYAQNNTTSNAAYNPQATGGYGAYDDSNAQAVGQAAVAEAQSLVSAVQGKMTAYNALNYINQHASSAAVARMAIDTLGISDWLVQSWAAGNS